MPQVSFPRNNFTYPSIPQLVPQLRTQCNHSSWQVKHTNIHTQLHIHTYIYTYIHERHSYQANNNNMMYYVPVFDQLSKSMHMRIRKQKRLKSKRKSNSPNMVVHYPCHILLLGLLYIIKSASMCH